MCGAAMPQHVVVLAMSCRRCIVVLQLHQHHAVTKRTVPVDTSREIDYFNNNKQYPEPCQYNQTFRFPEGYNQKLKRDDMQHTQVHIHVHVHVRMHMQCTHFTYYIHDYTHTYVHVTFVGASMSDYIETVLLSLLQGLDIFSEEDSKPFPILSSSEYGRRPALDVLDKQYVRVGTVKKDFYRSRGINV